MSQELHEPETSVTPPPARRSPSVRRPASPSHGAHQSKDAYKSPTSGVYPEEEDGFFAKHKVKFIVGALMIAVIIAALLGRKPGKVTPPRKEQVVMVQLPPPPPPVKPPPPPPPQKAPPPDKMEKETAPTEAPKDAPKAPPKTDNPPPTALATGIKGDGPGMGLASSGSGLGGGNLIGGSGNGGNAASKYGWYAGQVQTKIIDALKRHPKTRSASISSLQVRIWPDTTGRITRASLAGSTGQADVDAAIEREVLGSLQLQEPPPAGMKLPIVLRISAKRSN